MTTEQLKERAAQHGLKGECFPNVVEALDAARRAAHPRDFIYVGGSMYVLAELLTAINYDDHLDN